MKEKTILITGGTSGIGRAAAMELANILFTYELVRRWGDTGIAANAAHPGAVRTNFGNESKPFFRYLLQLGKPFLKSPSRGADTIAYLASAPEVEGITGKYVANRKPIRYPEGNASGTRLPGIRESSGVE